MLAVFIIELVLALIFPLVTYIHLRKTKVASARGHIVRMFMFAFLLATHATWFFAYTACWLRTMAHASLIVHSVHIVMVLIAYFSPNWAATLLFQIPGHTWPLWIAYLCTLEPVASYKHPDAIFLYTLITLCLGITWWSDSDVHPLRSILDLHSLYDGIEPTTSSSRRRQKNARRRRRGTSQSQTHLI